MQVSLMFRSKFKAIERYSYSSLIYRTEVVEHQYITEVSMSRFVEESKSGFVEESNLQ
jgi:hypothetical protein